MKDSKLLEIAEDILNGKKVSLNTKEFKSFNNLELDTDTSTITGADNSVQCADVQKIFNEIKKMSDSLENKFFENKYQIKNYKIEPNTLSITKKSVVSAKENYSNKEKKWFEEFSKI